MTQQTFTVDYGLTIVGGNSIESDTGNVAITSTGANTWTFGNTGTLTVPYEGIIQSLDDTVILQSKDTGTGNIYSARLGTNGGMYFETTEYSSGWLNLTNDSGNASIIAPAGNITITPAVGEGNGVGKSLNLRGGNADQSDYYTGTGGAVNIVGGFGGFNDGGGGGPGGDVNLTAGVSSDPAGHAGNINITAGSNNWVFDYTGNIQGDISFTGATITINNAPGGNEGAEVTWALPSPANTVLSTSLAQDVFQNGMRFFETGGNTRGLYMDLGNAPNGSTTAVGYRDIPQVSFTGNTTIATTDAGRHYYSTQSTGYTLTIANNASQGFQVGAAITIINQGTGNITVAQGSGVTLYLAGNATSGNRSVATFGMATIIKVATDTWFINGTGVS